MKYFTAIFLVLPLFGSGQAWALSTNHPANPAAITPAFQAVDFFAAERPLLTAAESTHQHGFDAGIAEDDGDAAHEHASAAKQDHAGKSCKRSEGCCCSCKCCGKGGGDEAESSSMKGCGMMKKGMMMEEGKKNASDQPAAAKGDGHEAHH